MTRDPLHRESSREALARLDAERMAGQPAPSRLPGKVPLRDLHTEPSAFQVREDQAPDPDHVAEIAGGLGSDLDEHLGVWWSGTRWIVIDGHHRHAGYLEAVKAGRIGMAYKVPVKVHDAPSAAAARMIAAQVNNRDRKRITVEERTAEAWRMVCNGIGSKAEQAQASGARLSTIGNMRAAFKRLHEGRGIPAENLEAMGWERARKLDKGKDVEAGEWSDAMDEAAAQDWAKRISKALDGRRIVMNPGRMARALEILSGDLPGNIIEEWGDHARAKGWVLPEEDEASWEPGGDCDQPF